jgi:hypothetical protein
LVCGVGMGIGMGIGICVGIQEWDQLHRQIVLL